MSRSQLVYRVVMPEGPIEDATVVTIHGYNGSSADLIPLARSLGSHVRIVAPEALNGVFHGRLTTGRMWFRGVDVGCPEPGSFGDSLWQLEQFIYDLLEGGQCRTWPPLLLGYDQGAVLALATALIIPDYLAGIIAIRGYLPDLLHWPIEARPMDGVPVLLLSDPDDTSIPDALTKDTVRQLRDHGARVSMQVVPGVPAPGAQAGMVLRQWVQSLQSLP